MKKITITLCLLASSLVSGFSKAQDRAPNLCWWNMDNSGVHKQGPNLTPEQMCDAVAAIEGAHDIPPRKHWGLIESRGQNINVTMTEWSGSLAGEAPFGPSIGDKNQKRRREIINQMKAWIDLASRKKIPKMLCFLGNKSGDDEDAQWKWIDKALKELAAYAKKKNVILCFEPLNDRNFGKIALAGMKGHPGQFCSDPLQIRDHLEKVGMPKYCGLAFDFYHPSAQYRDKWVVKGNVEASRKRVTAELISMYDQCREYVHHVHVAGCFLDDTLMRGELHLPGQLIDYRAVMTHVWASGYKGNYLIEYVTTEGADKPVTARQKIVLTGHKSAVDLCKPTQ